MKDLAITHEESLWLMDSFRVSEPRTKALSLRIAQLVLEFENELALATAVRVITDYNAKK